jgi:SAM-dependent methyltransferase
VSQGPEPAELDLDELIQALKRKVEERRQEGFYPPGLEDDLDGHFRRIVSHRSDTDLSELDAALARLSAISGLSPSRIVASSAVPGGSAVHRTVARAVARQTQGILEQVEEVVSSLREVVNALSQALRKPDSHLHPDLLGQVDALQERLSGLERQPSSSPAGLAEVSRRLEKLEAAEARRGFRPSFSAAAFEAAFRGSESDLKERYRDLAQRMAGCGPVLDIGCGRGEMMELLAELGVRSRGVEMDAELVAAARGRGLDVDEGDGLLALAQVPESSLGGLVLIQVVEHFSAQEVVDLVSLARDKLRPGGKAVIETVNPQSLYVFARAFFLDPTHDRPVHPGYLAFLFQQAGFSGVDIDWRSLPPQEEVLEPVGDMVGDANVRRLNGLLFAPQDYAVIATR